VHVQRHLGAVGVERLGRGRGGVGRQRGVGKGSRQAEGTPPNAGRSPQRRACRSSCWGVLRLAGPCVPLPLPRGGPKRLDTPRLPDRRPAHPLSHACGGRRSCAAASGGWHGGGQGRTATSLRFGDACGRSAASMQAPRAAESGIGSPEPAQSTRANASAAYPAICGVGWSSASSSSLPPRRRYVLDRSCIVTAYLLIFGLAPARGFAASGRFRRSNSWSGTFEVT
jgi:hypothetical protein